MDREGKALDQRAIGNIGLIAAIIILSGIALACGNNKTTPTLTLIMVDLGINTDLAGWLGTAPNIAGLILALPGGAIMMKVGAKRLGIACLAITLLGNLVGVLANDFTLLLIGRVLEGVGFGLFTVVAPAILTALFPPEKRGMPMALWSMSIGLGTLLVIALAGGLTDVADPSTWNNVWIASSALLAVCAVLFALVVKVPEAPANETGEAPASFADGLKSATTWLIAATFMVFTAGLACVMVLADTYMQTGLGLDAGQSGLALMLMQVGSLVGGLMMGAINAKVRNRGPVIIVGAVLTAIGFAFAFAYPAAAAVPFMVVFGLICAILPATIYSMAGEAAASPATVGVTTGVMALGNNLGGFASAAIGVIVASAGFGGGAVFCTVLGVLLVIAALAFVVAMRKKTASTAS